MSCNYGIICHRDHSLPLLHANMQLWHLTLVTVQLRVPLFGITCTNHNHFHPLWDATMTTLAFKFGDYGIICDHGHHRHLLHKTMTTIASMTFL